MKESEIDAETKRLKEKRRVDVKKEKLDVLKASVEPGLIDQVWKYLKPLWKKL